jgi:hypothetical protein
VSSSTQLGQRQGSQAPPKDFDQLVEGPWPISTSSPPGGLWGRGSAFWRENWSKHPHFGPRISISWSKTLSISPKFRASGPHISTRRRACEPCGTVSVSVHFLCNSILHVSVTASNHTRPLLDMCLLLVSIAWSVWQVAAEGDMAD